MSKVIRVGILEDHQSVIDGYMYRLETDSDIQVVGTALFGGELFKLVEDTNPDVLLVDLCVPDSENNNNAFPVRHKLSTILEKHENLGVIVISIFHEEALVRALFDMGIRGYIVKDDYLSIKKLPEIIKTVKAGGIYMSADVQDSIISRKQREIILTPRQIEAC